MSWAVGGSPGVAVWAPTPAAASVATAAASAKIARIGHRGVDARALAPAACAGMGIDARIGGRTRGMPFPLGRRDAGDVKIAVMSASRKVT
jgi:hypothetical protein